MERIVDFKVDKQSIYEIYRACRLCGAGAGYKMPIIQTVIDIDGNGMELRQKIMECLQIEVHQDDKMPPLICELCVDKVNDFYDFFELCKQTNKRTRLQLGLPLNCTPAKETAESGDCILGITEPLYRNEDNEPLSRKTKQKSVKIKKEPDAEIVVENKRESRSVHNDRASRVTRQSKRPPTPNPARARSTRGSTSCLEDNMALSCLKEQTRKAAPKEVKSSKEVTSPKDNMPMPKSILNKELKALLEENDYGSLRSKRSRDNEPVKSDVPPKRVKIMADSAKSSSKNASKTLRSTPTSSASTSSASTLPYTCPICGVENRTAHNQASHMKTHIVTFTDEKLACNPCGRWFSSRDGAVSHHRRHRTKEDYKCRQCLYKFSTLEKYDRHIENKKCISRNTEANVKCQLCNAEFPNETQLQSHNCTVLSCSCGRIYMAAKNLKRHQLSCNNKKKDRVIVDPEVRKALKPLQVRVARCDSLLQNSRGQHYDVSSVSMYYGLDLRCVYPYLSTYSSARVKSEPLDLDGMVVIEPEIQNEICTEEYVHWDSEDSDNVDNEVESLTSLSLKTIFSTKFLGKVPQKRRRFKMETLVNDNGANDNLSNDIHDNDSRDSVSIFDSLVASTNFDCVDRGIINSVLINDNDFGNSNVNINDGTSDNDMPSNDSPGNNSLHNNDTVVNTISEANDGSQNNDLSDNISTKTNDVFKNNDLSDNISSETNGVLQNIDISLNSSLDNNDVTEGKDLSFKDDSDNNYVSENNGVSRLNDSTESINVKCNITDVIVTNVSVDENIEEMTNNKELDSIKSNDNLELSESSLQITGHILNISSESSLISNDKDTNHVSDSNDAICNNDKAINDNFNNDSKNHVSSVTTSENFDNECSHNIDRCKGRVENFAINDNVISNDSISRDNGRLAIEETDNTNRTNEIHSTNVNDNKSSYNNEKGDVNNCKDSNDLPANNDNASSNTELANGAINKQTKSELENISDTELEEDRKLMEALDEQLGEGKYSTNDNSHNDNATRDNSVIVNKDSRISDCITNNDNFTAINDTVTVINDTVTAINDTVTAINDTVTAINDTVTPVNDNGIANNDSVGSPVYNESSIKGDMEIINDKDKIILEDLLPNNDLKSLELDSISDDEFNFDA